MLPWMYVLAVTAAEESLLVKAALLFTFLTILAIAWAKFAEIVRLVWTDFTAAVEAVVAFWNRMKGSRPGP
jgi:hypothetical protein